MQLILYTKEDCPACEAAKKLVPSAELRSIDNIAVRKELEDILDGDFFVPVLKTEDTLQVLANFGSYVQFVPLLK